MKIMVTAFPFGTTSPLPKRLLSDLDVHYRQFGKRPSQQEIKECLSSVLPDIIIADTEEYPKDVLDLAPNLKLISRVGIGYDSIDLDECKRRNIAITNTPDAPTNAVAELVICQMLNALRRIKQSDEMLRKGVWKRWMGRELRGCDVGVIGCGRIGRMVIQKLQSLKPRRIFGHDIIPDRCHNLERTEPESKLQIFTNCDIVTIHIPYNKENHHFVNERILNLMKPEAILINTSRGNIVEIDALYNWLEANPASSAVIDVFPQEPYNGGLTDLPNTYLTPHLGSCTIKSRTDMEVGAVEEVLNFISGSGFTNRVI